MKEFDKRLSRIRPAQHGLAFPRRGCVLHTMPTACGYQKISTAAYSWDGLQRGAEEFAVFQYTVSGEGRLRYESQEHVLHCGDAMLVTIPHDHRYYFPPGTHEEWTFVYLCLTGQEALRLCRRVLAERGAVFRLPAASRAVQAVVHLLERAAVGRLESPHRSSALAYEFLMALLDDAGADSAAAPEIPAAIQRAVEYCRRHFADPVTIDKLASVAGYSRYHFTRLFKTHTGLTPVQYLTEVRLRAAVRLLRDTPMGLKEIAPCCGFPDGNYLCRVFHRAYGITPGTFRKSGMYV